MVDIQWDPVREARLLKRWALLALLLAVVGITPVYFLLLGLSGFQAALAMALGALYTFVSIELVTRWDYRMRRRHAYPHRLGYELAGIHDFTAACERGAELVGQWLGAKAAIVAWLSEDGEALLPIAAYGFPPNWMKLAPHVPVDPHSLRQSLREGRPLESSSINGERWFESIGNREPITYVPLISRERPEGVLAVASGGSETRDQRLLAALGMVMGLALDNVRLYEGQRARAHHLQQINRMKSDFLTTVSHELRTPLTSIKMAAEMLLEEEEKEAAADETRVRLVRNIVRGTSRLTSLVADLVNVSREDEFQPRLELDEAPLDDIVASAATIIQPLVAAKRQKLEIRLAVPDTILLVDRLRFEQVLINLLSNAQRYTPAGGLIEVGSRVANGEVIVTVTDSGPGVAPEDRERIFEPFYRGDRSGLGLGLAIAKSLVELHNGRIWVESSGHGGSRFSVAIPSQRTANVRPLDPISASN